MYFIPLSGRQSDLVCGSDVRVSALGLMDLFCFCVCSDISRPHGSVLDFGNPKVPFLILDMAYYLSSDFLALLGVMSSMRTNYELV